MAFSVQVKIICLPRCCRPLPAKKIFNGIFPWKYPVIAHLGLLKWYFDGKSFFYFSCHYKKHVKVAELTIYKCDLRYGRPQTEKCLGLKMLLPTGTAVIRRKSRQMSASYWSTAPQFVDQSTISKWVTWDRWTGGKPSALLYEPIEPHQVHRTRILLW